MLYCYGETGETKLVVPKDEILKFDHATETAGHSELRRDVAKHVKECIECEKYKATNLKPP